MIKYITNTKYIIQWYIYAHTDCCWAFCMVVICCATTDNTSISIRLNSSKQAQAPALHKPHICKTIDDQNQTSSTCTKPYSTINTLPQQSSKYIHIKIKLLSHLLETVTDCQWLPHWKYTVNLSYQIGLCSASVIYWNGSDSKFKLCYSNKKVFVTDLAKPLKNLPIAIKSSWSEQLNTTHCIAIALARSCVCVIWIIYLYMYCDYYS